MIYIVQNLAPILAATVAGLLVGAAHHLLTGRASHAPAATRPPMLMIALVAEFWLACILAGALILAPPEAPAWIMALATPVIIWAGFVAPVLATTHAYRRVSLRIAAFDAAHWLAVMLAQALVLTLIGLTAPVS